MLTLAAFVRRQNIPLEDKGVLIDPHKASKSFQSKLVLTTRILVLVHFTQGF